jgi:hypothetical protein
MRIPGAVVCVFLVVVDVERQRRVFNPSSFVHEIHLDAPLLEHLHQLRELGDAAAAPGEKRVMLL